VVAAAANVNALWSALLIEELVRHDVRLFVIAPGSRSAPIALAVAGNPRAKWLMHVDERGAAFAALGHARATGRPAALVTTSGTAVANALPAAVEADHDGVPLLLLTADRPPELRETGANQSIRQPSLLAGAVRWSFDMPAPSAEVDPAFVLTTAAQAVHRCMSPPGAVHLNLMFREPLTPAPDGTDAAALTAHLEGWLAGAMPYTRHAAPAVDATAAEALAEMLEGVERGLLVVGKSDDPGLAPAAARLGAALGWPVLGDIGSGLRCGAGAPSGAPMYDLALASDRLRSVAPEAVLHLAGPITSRRLTSWLADSRPHLRAVVRRGPARYDPTHAVTHRIEADPAAWADVAAGALMPATAATDWLLRWKRASDAVERELEHSFADDDLTEPRAARIVAAGVPDGGVLVVASSMPVRDLDGFAAPARPALRVAANRGASGIDGTVSMAAGFAHGAGAPAALLIGDLALLHDLNGLGLLRDPAVPPVVVVVINNDGGGIFSFLPVARSEGIPFDVLFGTPHGLTFEHAAAMYGLPYARPAGAAALRGALDEAFAARQSALIEVRTERTANRDVHAALVDRMALRVDEALAEAGPAT